jgi:hypothetical protein
MPDPAYKPPLIDKTETLLLLLALIGVIYCVISHVGPF